MDLAPVMDIVAASQVYSNQPIGIYGREYGNDAGTVQSHATAFITGMQSAGVAATLKHFPGLGHVTGNTDFTDRGVVDTVTDAQGPDVATFGSGVHAGAQLVMVSTAVYTHIDAANQAAFSPAVMALLRSQLGFDGVIVSDSLGGAAAVAAMPPAQRALRFLRAGGDLVLTTDTSIAPAMVAAVLAALPGDPALRTALRSAALRILSLKQALRLPASGGGIWCASA